MILASLLFAAGAQPLPAAPAREVNPPSLAARAVWLADAAVREPRSEVLVLGTPHLSALPPEFDRANLAPLLDRLAAWQPAMIMVEGLGGAQCDELRRFAAAIPGAADDYCPDAQDARTALGLDQPGAEREIDKLLGTPVADRPAAARRRLAALFLAAGDPASARVQWLRLPEAERVAGDGLTPELVARIEARGKRPNENRDIAATLAARLAHERVWPVDDHTSDRIYGTSTTALEQRMSQIWDNRWSAQRRPLIESELAQIQKGGVLAVYRAENSVAAARLAVASDFAAAGGDDDARRLGRIYLGAWETRNLRMVANIREAMAPHPGIRVLAVVGASHKPYYERYLGVTSEVRIADAGLVLK